MPKHWARILEDTSISPDKPNVERCRYFPCLRAREIPHGDDECKASLTSLQFFVLLQTKVLRDRWKTPQWPVTHPPPAANEFRTDEFGISLQLPTATYIIHIFPITGKGFSTTAWLWQESWKLKYGLLFLGSP